MEFFIPYKLRFFEIFLTGRTTQSDKHKNPTGILNTFNIIICLVLMEGLKKLWKIFHTVLRPITNWKLKYF